MPKETKCTRIDGVHSWGLWYPYDPMVFEIKEMKYRYRRTCNWSGCQVQEEAEDLTPVGVTKLENLRAAT